MWQSVRIVLPSFVAAVLAHSFGYASEEVRIPPMYGWMVKVDAADAEQWHRVYGYPRSGHVETAIRTAEGGYALIGNIRARADTTMRSNTVPWLVVTDGTGNLLWEREYLTDMEISLGYSSSLAQLDDGGFVLAGWVFESGGSYTKAEDAWVIRTDPQGNVLWTTRLGDSIAVMGATVAPMEDGGFLVATVTQPKDHLRIYAHEKKSYSQGMLVKLNAEGGVQWVKTYSDQGWDTFSNIVSAQPSGYLVTGRRHGAVRIAWIDETGRPTRERQMPRGIRSMVPTDYGYLISGEADRLVYQMKIGLNGDSLLARSYLEGSYCTAVPTADGGSVLVGATFKHGAGSSDGLLIKTDPLGKMEWYRTYGGTELDQFRMVFPTDDGGYILVGSTGSFTE